MKYAYYGNELYHHGIKGQKWGVRNYQNKDGSLTPAGLKRYSDKDVYKAVRSHHKLFSGQKQRDDLDKRVSSRISKDDLAKSKELAKKVKKLQLSEKDHDDLAAYGYDGEHSGVSKKRAAELESRYKAYSEASKDYSEHNRKVAKSILGKYADKPVSSFKFVKDNATDTVEYAIRRLADRD